MKERQQTSQEVRTSQREDRRERRDAPRRGPAVLSVQQWTRLLRHPEDLPELPPELLGQLAEAVGNGCLTALLRQGGGGGPGTCLPVSLEFPAAPEEINRIQTAEPALVRPPVWPLGGPLAPARPGALREMGL